MASSKVAEFCQRMVSDLRKNARTIRVGFVSFKQADDETCWMPLTYDHPSVCRTLGDGRFSNGSGNVSDGLIKVFDQMTFRTGVRRIALLISDQGTFEDTAKSDLAVQIAARMPVELKTRLFATYNPRNSASKRAMAEKTARAARGEMLPMDIMAGGFPFPSVPDWVDLWLAPLPE